LALNNDKTALGKSAARFFDASLVGEVRLEDLAAGNPGYIALVEKLTQGENIGDYKKTNCGKHYKDKKAV
jgi:hypothetical protein